MGRRIDEETDVCHTDRYSPRHSCTVSKVLGTANKAGTCRCQDGSHSPGANIDDKPDAFGCAKRVCEGLLRQLPQRKSEIGRNDFSEFGLGTSRTKRRTCREGHSKTPGGLDAAGQRTEKARS